MRDESAGGKNAREGPQISLRPLGVDAPKNAADDAGVDQLRPVLSAAALPAGLRAKNGSQALSARAAAYDEQVTVSVPRARG